MTGWSWTCRSPCRGRRVETCRWHSIRINDQWRVIFKWIEDDSLEVRITTPISIHLLGNQGPVKHGPFDKLRRRVLYMFLLSQFVEVSRWAPQPPSSTRIW